MNRKMNKKTKLQFVICLLVPLVVLVEEIIKMVYSQNKSILTYIFLILYANLIVVNLYAIRIVCKTNKNKKQEMKRFYKVLSPAAVIIYFCLGALLIVIAFIVVFFVTYYFLALLLALIPVIKLDDPISIIFLSSLSGLCILSYCNEKIMSYVVKQMQLSKKDSKKIYQLGIDSIRFVNPRKLMYFLTILFYILVYLTEQNGGRIVGLEWWNGISEFAEAILITFVAIDTYIEHARPNFIEKLEKGY